LENPTQHDPEYLSIQGAAKRIKVNPNTIRNLIKSGDLKAVRIGSKIIRIKSTDLEALFTSVEGGEFGIWKSII
jgi:excisionase family DNA binding protein